MSFARKAGNISRWHPHSRVPSETRRNAGRQWFLQPGRGRAGRVPASLDISWSEYPKHTTPLSPRVWGWVTVTHPYHPLCGQQVEILRVRRGPDPDLIIRHLDGYHGAIAASWTTYASAPDAFPF